MASNGRERVLVVLSLNGGNDMLNSLVPYNNSQYYDYRTTVNIPQEQVIPINDELGYHPAMTEFKTLYDEGKAAIIQGVGYPHPSLSHFRSMDIWHTCEPDKIGTEGWLGRALRDLDPKGENVLTGVNFGRGLPRSMVAPGVMVASVGDLATYGVLTPIESQNQRMQALEVFSKMYSPAIGSGPVMDYIWETGRGALKGADILKDVPSHYSSSVEYGDDAVAQGMKGIAQVHLANLGSRILYTTSPFNSFDNHSNQMGDHSRMWRNVSKAVDNFYADLREHGLGEEVLLLIFSEFGRRARDNGSGTDHGTGGVCWVVGDHVAGGLYGQYPSLKPDELEDGNLLHSVDFRSVYSTIIEQWLGLEATPIVGGSYEQLNFMKN